MTRIGTVTVALMAVTTATIAGVPGNTITYQGLLKDNGAHFDGPANLEFRLFDDELAGSQIGSTVMATETVTDGLFAADLDFGVTPYAGTDPLWLEVTVEGQVLARQEITPAPFSMATRGIDVDANGRVSIDTAPTANRLTVGGVNPIPEPQPGALNGSTNISAMALDAVIEVVGAQAGSISAGFGLKELAMDGSHLSTWSLVRETGVNGALVIQNGTDPNPFGNTERMRITATGDVGIGATMPASELDVAGTVTATAFVGDGSGLTGLPTGSSVWAEDGADISYETGNVGIGTTTPQAPLDVLGQLRFDQVGNSRGMYHNVTGNHFQFTSNNTTEMAGVNFLRMKVGGVDKGKVSASQFEITNDLICDANVGIGTTTPTTELDVVGTVTATAFVGDGSGLTGLPVSSVWAEDGADISYETGNVGIGTDAPESKLHLHDGSLWISGGHGGNLPASAGKGLRIFQEASLEMPVIQGIDYSTLAGVDVLLQPDGGSVGIGTVAPGFMLHVNGSAGKPGGGSWSVASDVRLKKNIADVDGALDTLLALRGVTFEYHDPAAINELAGVRTGFVAQEVEAVIPDWVAEAQDGYKRVTIRGFEALAVEAFRELAAENDALRDEVSSLNDRLARLERLLSASGGK